MALKPKKNAHTKKEAHLISTRNDILIAALRNDIQLVESILSEHPHIICHAEISTGNTALHIAVMNGNFSMVQLLLSKPHLDITLKNHMGFDPLDLALRLQHQPKITDALFRFRAAQLDLDGKPKPSGP